MATLDLPSDGEEPWGSKARAAWVAINADAEYAKSEVDGRLSRDRIATDNDLVGGNDQRILKIETQAGVFWAVLDDAGRLSWNAVNDVDGGPTPWGVSLLGSYTGYLHVDTNGIGFSVVDASDRQSDLSIDDVSGEILDFVMDRWAPRIASRIGGGATATEYYMHSLGKIESAKANKAKWAVVGSSTAERVGPALALRATSHGATLWQGGKGSERSWHSAARLGSVPALLTFPGNSIPASGATVVTSSNMPPGVGLRPYEVLVAGVLGTLSSTDTEITWTRTTAGSAVTVTPDVLAMPTLGPQYRDAIMALNMGKNDLLQAGGELTAVANGDASFKYMTPLYPRTVVIGQFNNTYDLANDPARPRAKYVNDYQRAKYGPLFIDIDAFLTGPDIWTYTGITPTGPVETPGTDLYEQAMGNKPPSVSITGSTVDPNHLNAAGNTALARLIEERYVALGWI